VVAGRSVKGTCVVAAKPWALVVEGCVFGAAVRMSSERLWSPQMEARSEASGSCVGATVQVGCQSAFSSSKLKSAHYFLRP